MQLIMVFVFAYINHAILNITINVVVSTTPTETSSEKSTIHYHHTIRFHTFIIHLDATYSRLFAPVNLKKLYVQSG